MPNIDWMSFAMGLAFAMFVLPFLTRFLGSIKGQRAQAQAV